MLSPIQKDIVKQPGNLIVRASAGTGKTHTMVSKIVYDIEHQHSHRVIAAITFTIKAANEIKERLPIDTREHFIGTNNSFVIEEVIKPFMKDVYGKDYKVNMSTDYSEQINSFAEGIAKVKNDQLLCSYSNRKENFIFQLALDIVKKSSACQLYLQAKYFKIYIDEYQDCDKDMHEFFMYLCDDLKIDTFVVGDEKQSIYIWRGADQKLFMSIWKKENFSKKFMLDNFRSCKQIQNYSNLLFKETRNLYSAMSDLTPVNILYTTQQDWAYSIQPYIDSDKKCALLRYTHNNAEICSENMTNAGLDFTYVPRTPIADITTESAWLYNALAKYFIVSTYSAYNFINEIPNEIIGNKQIINSIKRDLLKLEESIKGYDLDKFKNHIEMMAQRLGYTTKLEHCQQLYRTITDTKYHPAFNVEKLQRIATTFHSSKGLEFDQVVLFMSDYPKLDEQEIYNHYVAATRAKSKLIMVHINGDRYAAQFDKNIRKIITESGLKLENVATIVNC